MAEPRKETVNRRNITIEFGDCDPAGIVHYRNYFRWFDEGTHYLFAKGGFPPKQLACERNLSIPLVSVRTDFKGPVAWGDELVVESRFAAWGTRSFEIAHKVVHAATGAAVSEALETRVFINADSVGSKHIRSVSVPADIRAAFGG